MKKHILLVALLVIGLAVLLPFASKAPDGLQKLTDNSGAQQPVWSGLMGGYTVTLGDNSYISTLTAGLLGTGMVLLASYALSSAVSKKPQVAPENA